MNTIIKHDNDGFLSKAQGTTGVTCKDNRAGFVFHTVALQIAQESARGKPWGRWDYLEGLTDTETTSNAPAPKKLSLAQLRMQALEALRAA